jgi:hypothetical protein
METKKAGMECHPDGGEGGRGGVGDDTSSEPESSEEEKEEEGEVTPPPLSPPRVTLPSFGDILSRQAGVPLSVRQPNQT